MKIPPLTTILALYAIATGLLWIATRILAPKEQKPSIFRCLGVAFALTVLGNAARYFLMPVIGDWALLVPLVLYVLLVKGLFSLPLWRSVLVAAFYFAGLFVVYLFLMAPAQ
jgi:hypothetical protein